MDGEKPRKKTSMGKVFTRAMSFTFGDKSKKTHADLTPPPASFSKEVPVDTTKELPPDTKKEEHLDPPPPSPLAPTPKKRKVMTEEQAKHLLRRSFAEHMVRPRAEAKEKLKETLEGKLKGSMDNLKEKVTSTKHQQKVSEIQDLIRGNFDGLAFQPTKEKLDEFNAWFEKMLDSQKDAFPEENWVWHDVIKPALMIFLGVIFTLITAAIRPFVQGIGAYANTFFQKPETEGFKQLKEAAREMQDEMRNSLALGG